ncbi:MAG TPA: histidinol dehydrogenase, partial [Kofleriaceae bacterium]|nr:histidinol dehydrogenase [Kofleriaceae bacterium]
MALRRIQPGDLAGLQALCARSAGADAAVDAAVAEVLAAVRARGDAAVRDYTERFERRTLDPARHRDGFELQAGDPVLAPALAAALQRAAARIRAFHERQRESGYAIAEGGARLELRVEPLARVGIYVPGGTAAYPSSVLMNAVPARVAGVGEIVMVSPRVSDPVLAAARLAGVDRIFEIGGAQAVAALAYGTASVPRVDKIVGPGNQWVAAAKRMVFGEVDIDSIAGPSEVLIIADDGADPRLVAADLLAQ